MAGVANEAYNYNKDSNEGIDEEEEEEQIYDSIDENSSDSFSLSNEKELKDEHMIEGKNIAGSYDMLTRTLRMLISLIKVV